MTSYVIFNKKTGDIVHKHAEVALSGDPLPVTREDLVAMYRPRPGQEIDAKDLDVLEVDADLLRLGQSNRKNLYIDVQKRVLTERAKGR